MIRAQQDSCDASRNGLHTDKLSYGGEFRRNGRMARTVFGDVVEVIPTDDDCARHLSRDDTASENASADGHATSEGALLVYTTRE